LHHRQNYPSHFTTRLDAKQINIIKTKFNEWITYEHPNVIQNKIHALKHSHERIYHCFETLLKSGMRVGELVSINFKDCPAHRFIKSKLHNEIMAEIIINTEKTRKKREVYIPIKSYLFFKQDSKKLSKDLIVDGFVTFRR
jgi:integrase